MFDGMKMVPQGLKYVACFVIKKKIQFSYVVFNTCCAYDGGLDVLYSYMCTTDKETSKI
jgi:hypothetical protein